MLFILDLRVIESKMNTHLVCLAYTIEVYQLVIHLVGALCHLLDILHFVSLPVTELSITARLVEIAGLTDHHLTHLVDEKALPTRQESQKCSHGQSLSVNKLAQIKLL